MLNRFRVRTLTTALVTVILWALFPAIAAARTGPGYGIAAARQFVLSFPQG